MKIWRAIQRWYQQVIPLEGATLGLILFFLMSEGLMMVLYWRQLGPNDWWAPSNEFGGSVCGFCAAGYAAYRVLYFQPVWRPGYRKWLSATPWHPRLPLPDGPVMLVPQDVIPLSLLTLGSLRAGDPMVWFTVPLLFFGFWVSISLATFWLVGPRWLAYCILVAGGGVVRFLTIAPEASVVLGVVMVLATQWGHYLCISRFHEWDLAWADKYGFDAVLSGNQEAIAELQTNALIGWPHEQLAPDIEKQRLLLSPLAGAQFSLLVTWFFDSTFTALNEVAWQKFTFGPLGAFVCAVAIGTSLFRAGAYVSGHAPPLGFFGRLGTGRLIIPGYDYIFVPSLTVLILALGGTYLLHELNAPAITSASCLLFLVLLLITTMPPDLAEFHFIGNHRINPDFTQRTSPHLIKE